MNADYPTDEVPATPEYVLEVFRDWHRIAVAAGEADSLELTFETPLWEWEDSLLIDTWGSGGVGAAMNAAWKIDIPKDEWHEFEWGRGTLGDLCRLIASRARRPVIRPWKHVGGDCLPAGAFLTVRSILAEAGVDPRHITPSTPLTPYLSQQLGSTWWRLSRLVPGAGAGPIPTHPEAVKVIVRCLLLLGLFCVIMACVKQAAWLAGTPPFFAAAVVLERLTVYWHFPNASISTFRDLAYALAGQRPRRRIQPTA